MTYRLGRIPSPYDPRTLRLSHYLSVAELPPAPSAVKWQDKVSYWGMLLNDKLGDCTCAAAGHAIQVWTANESGVEVTVSDADVLAAYRAVSGYVPGRPATDRGANMLDVLKYWSKTGVGGHKGIGYVAVDPRNLDQVRAALWLFGGLYGGCSVYQSWLSGPWDRTAGPVVGGHAWWLVGYDGADFAVVTWGSVRPFTAAGWAQAMAAQPDAELYAVLAPEWTAADGVASCGFDAHALANDLAVIAGQPLPYPDPPAPVPPPPSPDPNYFVQSQVIVGTTTFAGKLYPVQVKP